jgi:REP element-mobilizing transposase RayT
MARLARVIAVGVPHHITQRGNARRFILQDASGSKSLSRLTAAKARNSVEQRLGIRVFCSTQIRD